MPKARINVNSGRPLEALAHYSRALRVGDCVLQSGTTAIDRSGDVIGAGDVTAQVDAIFAIAEESMGAAGGRLEDVVSARLYVTDPAWVDAACRAVGRHLSAARPTLSVVPVCALARPAQLVEIELEAIDQAAERAVRVSRGLPAEELYSASPAIRVADRVWVGGAAFETEAPGGDNPYRETRETYSRIESLLEEVGATLRDVVCTRTSICNLDDLGEHRRARLEALGETRPSGTLVGTPPFANPARRLDVEAEAIIGAASARRELYSEGAREKPLGFARAVVVGERIYISGATATEPDGSVAEPGDWARQYDRCIAAIADVLGQAGASLDDVVQRRNFGVAGAAMNRAYGEGPPWFAKSHPTALGCRIASLVHPDLVVEVDAVAVRGAHARIEWRSLPA